MSLRRARTLLKRLSQRDHSAAVLYEMAEEEAQMFGCPLEHCVMYDIAMDAMRSARWTYVRVKRALRALPRHQRIRVHQRHKLWELL